MEERPRFYTLKGYQRIENAALTYSMEDYLEMICRLAQIGGTVRVRDLAERLNVKPPSASKMAGKLRDLGLVSFEKYAAVTLTERGRREGEYLLYRHGVLHAFLCLVNGTDNELEQVEKIEHYLDRRTIENIAALVERLGGS